MSARDEASRWRDVLRGEPSASDAVPGVRDAAPRLLARCLVALALGCLSSVFLFGFTVQRRIPGIAVQSDFAVQWFCSRVLWAGGDPYLAAGPGRAFEWPAPLVYPATALTTLGPIAWLPLHAAEYMFVALATAMLAFFVTRRSWAPLCVFLTAPFTVAVLTVQWSPLLTVAAIVPALSWLVIAKPSVGLAIVAYYPSWRWLRPAVFGGVVVAGVTTALDPHWVTGWLTALQTRPVDSIGVSAGISTLYASPVTLPGGAVVLLALLRWRRPEARLLAAMAVVPHIMTGYELVPLLALVPATLSEFLVVAAGSWVARYGFALNLPYSDLNASYLAAGTWGLWCVLVPLTLIVLSRPNVGPVPAWLDAHVAPLEARVSAWWRRAVRAVCS